MVSNIGSNGKGKAFRVKTGKEEKRRPGLEDRKIREKAHALSMEKR